MKIIIFFAMLLLIGAFFIISENNLALKDSENRTEFAGLYTSWANKIFDNSESLAGYIVRLDWMPEKEN